MNIKGISDMAKRANILIASPVNKPPEILEQFLISLKELRHGACAVSYCFVDDNEQTASSDMLARFAAELGAVTLLPCTEILRSVQPQNGDHSWDKGTLDKIARVKNEMISFFLAGDYTHLFFIDSDLVLHPDTLLTLLDSERDIVANIFWTSWKEGTQPLPQVWLKDSYTLYDACDLSPKSGEEAAREAGRFLAMLRVPGIYKVGGLGACTLIRRAVLEAGVNFSPIYNLSFWGEDRSFCVRAVTHGFDLFVNTVYPAYHLYRMGDMEGLPYWKSGRSE